VLRRALQLVPDYLQTTAAPEAVNLMDYGFQLGRRFRAIKLWWVIRTFGVEGIRRRIAEHCRLAELFASWVEADPGFELAAPVPFSTICFRATWPGMAATERDARNERILERVNADGRVFLSHTKLRGVYTLHVAIGNLRTEERHLRVAWGLLRAAREGEA
jgi:aromatic-L-amino-acid decarboxylase